MKYQLALFPYSQQQRYHEIFRTLENQEKQLQRLLQFRFTAKLILGTLKMEVRDILHLRQGAILELNTAVNQDLEIWIDEHPIAKAETVVVGEKFGAQITKILSPKERLETMRDVDESSQ